jgi:hypothetical protein
LAASIVIDAIMLLVTIYALSSSQMNGRIIIGLLFAFSLTALIIFGIVRSKNQSKNSERSTLSNIDDINFTSLDQYGRFEFRKYTYDHVDVYVPEELHYDSQLIQQGKHITFGRDYGNAYDPEAVGVYRQGILIGYLFRNKLKDMAVDYLNSYNDEVLGYIDSVDDGKFTLAIGFYKDSVPDPSEDDEISEE